MTVKDFLSTLVLDMDNMRVVLHDSKKYLPDGVEYSPEYFEYEVPTFTRGDWRSIPTKYSEYAERNVHSVSIIGKKITVYMW